MNSRAYLIPMAGLVLAVSGFRALNGQPARRPASATRPSSISDRRSPIVELHLSSVQTTPDGKPVPGAPVVHALMQLDCQTNQFRRLGADVERADGVVMILPDSVAAYGWRSAVAGGPEALQLEASCRASR